MSPLVPKHSVKWNPHGEETTQFICLISSPPLYKLKDTTYLSLPVIWKQQRVFSRSSLPDHGAVNLARTLWLWNSEEGLSLKDCKAGELLLKTWPSSTQSRGAGIHGCGTEKLAQPSWTWLSGIQMKQWSSPAPAKQAKSAWEQSDGLLIQEKLLQQQL